jgi:hypothetical protein
VNDGLIFSLKSGQSFPRTGKLEIASPDDSLHTTLSLADASSSLILEGPDTLLATLQPLKAFGTSAFGPIRVRAIAPDGTAGDWLPLVTLVRLPTFTRLSCPVAAAPTPVAAVRTKAGKGAKGVAAPAAAGSASPAVAATDAAGSDGSATAAEDATSADGTPAGSAAAQLAAATSSSCSLEGTGLYFVDSVSTDEAFTNPIRVPEGFVGSSITVPPPTGAVYYLRLRDDPKNVDMVSLPAGPI